MADCKLFYFVTWGIIGGALCIFGFVGNTLSLLAFQKDKRLPPTTLLQALAVSDFVLLLSVFITDPIPYVCDYVIGCVNPWVSWPFIRYIWILTPIAHMCSIWFVVLIALNRYYAVCQALDMARVWNNQKTPIYIFVVLFVVVAFNMPRFLEYKVVQEACKIKSESNNVTQTYNYSSSYDFTQSPISNFNHTDNIINSTLSTETCWSWQEKRTEFGLQSSYKVVYKVLLVNILLVLVPIILLIAFTLKILVSLKETKKRIKSVKNANRNGVSAAMRKCSVKKQRNKNKNSHEITVILTLVVVVAIICQAPLCVFHFVRYTASYKCGHIVFYLDNISKLLVNVNSSANFIIYCLFSPKFRRLLLSFWVCYIFGLRPYDHQRDYTSVSRREYSIREYKTENILTRSTVLDKKADIDDKTGSDDKLNDKVGNQKEVTFDTSLTQLNSDRETNGGIPRKQIRNNKVHTEDTVL